LGTVTAITSDSLTFTGQDGSSHTVALGSSTTYSVQGDAATIASVTVGELVSVQCSASNSSGQEPTATRVNVVYPHLGGVVQSVSGSSGSLSIVVADPQGFWETIQTSASTTFTDAGTTVSDPTITAGEVVQAYGSVDPNHTTLDATSVQIGTPGQGSGSGGSDGDDSGSDS
jgi:hypothetical protein